jgi:hypothetical protein
VIRRFVDDEDGYLTWLSIHSTGYVLNCERNPRATYLVVHRATCATISGQPARGRNWNWTAAYQNVCSDSLPELSDLARPVGSLSACGLCHPDAKPS